MLGSWKKFKISRTLLSIPNIIKIVINLFRQKFHILAWSAQQKIFVIACAFDIMQFDHMLQKYFNCSYRGNVITNENDRTFLRSGIYLPIKVGNKTQSNNRNTRTRCEICSKLTIKTPEQHQLSSLLCLYCKLYTHFTTCQVFALLTLNMQLFTWQLSSFCEEKIHREAAM